MAGRYGTSFQETEVLLAVGGGDYDYVRQILADMSDGELQLFRETLGEVKHMLNDAAAAKAACRDQPSS